MTKDDDVGWFKNIYLLLEQIIVVALYLDR